MTPNGRAKSLVGKTFSLLTVLRRERSIGRKPAWLCRCVCGEEVVVVGERLKNGTRKACARNGHFWITTLPPSLAALHPNEYNIWQKMRERCKNPRRKGWNRYGGRGIKVCERWNEFRNFFEDMGERPSLKHSLDRHPNNDGNYEPGNCRWATAVQQRRNSSNNVYVEYQGERLLLIELMERLGLNYGVVKGRIVNGWNLEDALVTPVRKRIKNRPKHERELSRNIRSSFAPPSALDWPADCEVK